MKLNENDYFIKDNILFTSKNTQFSNFSTIQLENLPSDFEKIKALQNQNAQLFAICFNFFLIGNEENGFNEAFLADFRDALKIFDETLTNFVIFPLIENGENVATEEIAEIFYHCARRIKDCKAVAGFLLPKSQNNKCEIAIIDALKKKHTEYIYFVEENSQFEKLNQLYPNRIIVKS